MSKICKKRVHGNDKNNLPWDFKKVSWVAPFSTTEVCLCFGRASLRNTRLGASETLRTRLLSSQRISKKYIFYDQFFFFLQNEYMFKKDLYFICNTNILCIKIYFSNELHIFYIFIYIFLCKKSFFSKKIFRYKTFFPYKIVFFLQIMYIL